MAMGERGMKDMTEMEMPLPDNTAAMMTGTGPFGAGMGGMFSVVKVRKDQKAGDYKAKTRLVAPARRGGFYEWTGAPPDPARFRAEGISGLMPLLGRPAR